MQRKVFLMLMIILSAMMFSITAAAQQRFSVSLNGRQQDLANNSPGSGDCSIVLNATETQFTITCNYRNLTANVQQAHIHDVTGPIRFDLTYTGGPTGIIGPRTFNATAAQIANMRANRYYVNIHTPPFPAGEIRGQIKRANIPYDYDGDGRTDIVVHRRSATTIYTLNSLENNFTANQFGTGAGDNFINNIPGDFDGDGRADFVLIRVGADNVITWIILQSGTNTHRVERFGGGSDAITPSDYDGDGKLDIAVFRRPTGIWYILESSTGNFRAVNDFGAPGDLPVIGDYDGDGKADLCVVRGEGTTLAWWILNSSTGQAQKLNWGAGGDQVFFFFQIDVDNDGKQDLMTQRNENGAHVYYVRRSSDGQQYTLQWGLQSFFPLFGDYDGDGKTDFVNRQNLPEGYRWHIFQSATQSYRAFDFGQAGDQRPGQQGRGEPEIELPISSEVVGTN